MTLDNRIGLAIAVVVAAYLLFALLFPERL